MKFLLVTAIMVLTTILAYPQRLLIRTTDGETQAIEFTSNPKITIKNGNLIIVSTGSEISLPLSSVDKYTFTETDDSKIEPIIKNESPFTLTNDRIIFNPSDNRRNVTFYSVNGSVLKSFTIEPGPGGFFDTSALAPGIYIVKVNDITVKIAKK